MKQRRNKQRDVQRHVAQQAWNRFGLRRPDIEAVEHLIQSGRSRVVEKQSLRVSLHEVTYRDQTMHVAYDKARSQAITFMYADQRDYALGWYQPPVEAEPCHAV
jgi:hypothetical protein